jgi:hypothetical protein
MENFNRENRLQSDFMPVLVTRGLNVGQVADLLAAVESVVGGGGDL